MINANALLGISIALILVTSSFPFSAFAEQPLPVIETFTDSESDQYVPGQIVVGLKKSDPNFHSNIVAKGGKVINTIDEINAFVVKVPEHTVDKFISAISTNQNVDYVEKDAVVKAFYNPGDPFYTTHQWGMKRIGSESAWDTLTGENSGVKVAVIDTGMNYNHVDLTGRVDTANGYDFVDNDYFPLPSDEFCSNGDWEWHATFVAGIIAGIDNDVGIVGASQVEIIPVRVLNNCGSGSSSDVAAGIIWAANHEADVINLSLGSGRSSSSIQNAVITAYSQDVVIVASAGNSGSGRPNYPASYDEVISVSATDINDNLASYSTHNSGVELTAPGGDGNSCSTLSVSSGFHPNGGWDWMCAAGTSFSAPHVSGVAALLLAQYQDYPTITNQDIRNHLTLTAEDLLPSGRDSDYGYGMVRADIAVNTPISGVSLSTNPPTANNDLANTDEDTAVVIDVLLNDSNGDGTIVPTTVTVTSGPTNGQTSVDGTSGDITYTPDLDYDSNDSFTYTVQDDQGATSNVATVTLSVNSMDDAPTASDDSYTFVEDTQLDIVPIGVLSNDSDVDGDPLTSILDITTNNGVLALDSDGSFTYSPNAGATNDSFTYHANDGTSDSNSVTVTLTVNPGDTDIFVNSIVYDTAGGKNGDKHLTHTIFVWDGINPVSGASVKIALRNLAISDPWTGTATTGENGLVSFTLKNAPSGCYTTEVDSITGTGLNWNGIYPPEYIRLPLSDDSACP